MAHAQMIPCVFTSSPSIPVGGSQEYGLTMVAWQPFLTEIGESDLRPSGSEKSTVAGTPARGAGRMMVTGNQTVTTPIRNRSNRT